MKVLPVGAGGAFLLFKSADVCGFPKKLGKLPRFNLGMSGRVDTLSTQAVTMDFCRKLRISIGGRFNRPPPSWIRLRWYLFFPIHISQILRSFEYCLGIYILHRYPPQLRLIIHRLCRLNIWRH